MLVRLGRSKAVRSVFLPITVALVALYVARSVYGILDFPYLGTEDNYQLLLYGTTIYETGLIQNQFASIEPRVQNSPPVIPLLLAGFLHLAPSQGVLGILLIALLAQVATLYFIFRILRSVGLGYPWATLGMLIPLAFWRFAWVSSLSAPDSLLIALSAASGWLFIESVKERIRPSHLLANFAILAFLSWTHNFGILLSTISILAYLLVIGLNFDRVSGVSLAVGTSAWAVAVLPRLFLVISIYFPSVQVSVANPSVLAGLPFLATIPSYFGSVAILLLVPIGILSMIMMVKRTRGMFLFPVWMGLDLLVLAVIPWSFSHVSRYPLEFLVPIVVLMVIGLAWIYANLRVSTDTLGPRGVRRHLVIVIIAVLLAPLVVTAVSDAQSYGPGSKSFLINSYGLRQEIGQVLQSSYADDSILYIYWPSLITGYGGLPSENLIDFTTIIQNNENVVEVVLERQIHLFLYDRLSGTYHPFAERGRDLLNGQFIRLEEVHTWNAGAILYRIVHPDSYFIESVLASEPDLSGENLSGVQIQRIDAGPHGLIRPGEYPYRVLEAERGSLSLPLRNIEENSTILLSLAVNMPQGATLELTVHCGSRQLGDITIVPSTLVWWFDYHSTEFQLMAGDCDALDLHLQTDAPGQVNIHKIQMFVSAL